MKYDVVNTNNREGLGRYMLRTFPKVRGLAPLWAAMGGWAVMLSYVAYHSFMKTEVHLNRAASQAPWEWERAKHQFNKKHRALFDKPENWAEIPELTAIMNEMAEAERKL